MKSKRFIIGLARIADKLTTSGLVYNVLDENSASPGSLDKNKGVRDFIIWIPFALQAFAFAAGEITLDQLFWFIP